MNKKEATKLIYLELALTLQADIQDTGSWMYHGSVDWSHEDKETLRNVANEMANNYLELASLKGK